MHDGDVVEVIERQRPQNVNQAIIQIFDILVDLQTSVHKLEDDFSHDHERIGRLEKWQAGVTGAVAVIGTIGGYVLKVIADKANIRFS